MFCLHDRRKDEDYGRYCKGDPEGDVPDDGVHDRPGDAYCLEDIPHAHLLVGDSDDEQEARVDEDEEVLEERLDVVLKADLLALGLVRPVLLQRLPEDVQLCGQTCAARVCERRGDPLVPQRLCHGVGRDGHALDEGLAEHEDDGDGADTVDGCGAAVWLVGPLPPPLFGCHGRNLLEFLNLRVYLGLSFAHMKKEMSLFPFFSIFLLLELAFFKG